MILCKGDWRWCISMLDWEPLNSLGRFLTGSIWTCRECMTINLNVAQLATVVVHLAQDLFKLDAMAKKEKIHQTQSQLLDSTIQLFQMIFPGELLAIFLELLGRQISDLKAESSSNGSRVNDQCSIYFCTTCILTPPSCVTTTFAGGYLDGSTDQCWSRII